MDATSPAASGRGPELGAEAPALLPAPRRCTAVPQWTASPTTAPASVAVGGAALRRVRPCSRASCDSLILAAAFPLCACGASLPSSRHFAVLHHARRRRISAHH